MTFLLQAKERWTMYQLKAHFMPQLYWFGLIKVTQLIKSSFYRTQVNLGSDLWVRMSVCLSVTNTPCADLTGYQLNTN